MITNCTRCGQDIAAVITIDGKPFGTKCAEVVLGHKLPNNFSGDYTAHVAEVKETQTRLMNQRTQAEAITAELWEDAIALTKAYKRANDWGRGFLLSIESQLGFDGLIGCVDPTKFETVEDYLKSAHVTQYGLICSAFTKGLNTLSDKQRQLIERL